MTTAADPILDRLSRLYPRSIDLSLGRVRRLLDQLGNPEQRLPPVVHIAGTNGKGSTLAMLSAMFEADGKRAHRYISPHLVRFNERILLNGVPIADADLKPLLLEVEAANGDAPITFWEVTTAAAFLAFAQVPSDVLLLETGLGGRLDATNVVARPALTLLSRIGFDHEAYLGRTLTSIAREKCGILRPGVPALTARQRPPAALTIRQWATRIGADLVRAGDAFGISSNGADLVFRDASGTIPLPQPSLPGAHQIENAELAVAAARRLDHLLRPSPKAIASGLRNTAWPARLQRIEEGALLQSLRSDDELWIDGSHNLDGGAAAAAYFASLPPRPLRAVIGMLATKDVRGYVAFLAPLLERVVAVPVPGSAAGHAPEDVAAAVAALGVAASTAADLRSGLAELATGPTARIAVLGSLYLAGAALADNAGP